MAFNVTFVFYNNFTAYSWSPAIQALSAYIKKHSNCKVALIHINDRYALASKPPVIIKKIKATHPDLVAFTSTSFGYRQVNALAGRIKKALPQIPVVLGGVHATIKPEDLKSSHFDGFCIGEGEKPLLNLIRRMQKGEDYLNAPSFYFKANGRIIRNRLEPFEKDPDALPAYDWDIFDTHKLLKLRKGWLSLSVSRGCPFNCNFCINHRMKQILGIEGYVRQKSVGHAIHELKDLIRRFPVKVFNFDDDILIFNRCWTQSFLRCYKKEIYKKYGIKFKIEARVDLINAATLRKLKDAGCQEIQFGIETGNATLRNFVLNKSISDEQIIAAFDLCWKYGINTLAFVMLGIPGETEATVMNTIHILARVKPYLIRPSFIFPIYGTEFYNYCKKNRLLKQDIDMRTSYLWTQGIPIRLKGIDEQVLTRYMVLLPWYINSELGLREYGGLINRYRGYDFSCRGNTVFKRILRDDMLKSRQLLSKRIAHYRYFNDELNYLQYRYC